MYRKASLIALFKNPTREKYEKEAKNNKIIFIPSRLAIIFFPHSILGEASFLECLYSMNPESEKEK